MPDDRVNFSYGTVTVAPAPALSGATLSVSGFPIPEAPANAVVWAAGSPRPVAGEAEILRMEADAAGKLTVLRGQEGTSHRAIQVGDQIMFGETAATLTQFETLVESSIQAERERSERVQNGMMIGASVNYEGVIENTVGSKYLPAYKAHFGGAIEMETETKIATTFNSGTKAKPVVPNVAKYKAIMEAVGPDPMVVLHTMIWHTELPQWLTEPNVAWTPTSLRAAIKTYIQTVLPALVAATPRGEEQILRIDGLNEIAEAATGGKLRTSFWTEQFGAGSTPPAKTDEVMIFFKECLVWIREVCPNVPIAYNDFGCERESTYRTPTEVTEGKPLKKGDTMLRIAKVLLELGAPLNVIGYQCHLQTTFFPKADEATTVFEKAVAMNLQPIISELDVKLIEEEGKGTLGKQAEAVGELVRGAENVRMPYLIVWGVTDAKSWLGESTLTTGPRGLMFDTEVNVKPSYAPLAQARAGSGPTTRQMADKLSGESARAQNAPFVPSQEAATSTGRDCEVTLMVTLEAAETEFEVLVGGSRKHFFKRKTPSAGDVESFAFTVPASTAFELKTIKGAVTIKSTYAFRSR